MRRVSVLFLQLLHAAPRGAAKAEHVPTLQREVCGGCNDFKLLVVLDAPSFGEWEGKKFAPEEDFLKDVLLLFISCVHSTEFAE